MVRGPSHPSERSLSLEAHTYPCPVCWQGQLQPMVLMEAFGCNLCQQILGINLEQQAIYRLDITPPQGWRWQGQGWRSLHHPPRATTLTLILVSSMLVVCPAGIIALTAYLFPPLDPVSGLTWTWGWAGLTLMLHSLMVAWWVAEFYQLPVYRLLQIRLGQLYRGLEM